jgi:hypothetical protein
MLTRGSQIVDTLVVVVLGVGLVVSGCASVRSLHLPPDVYAGQMAQPSESVGNRQDLVPSKGMAEHEEGAIDHATGATITIPPLADERSDASSAALGVGEVVLYVAAAGLLLIVLLWK